MLLRILARRRFVFFLRKHACCVLPNLISLCAIMNVHLLRIICCFLLGASAAAAQPGAKISVQEGSDYEISIAVLPQIHADYGLSYPMTYRFAIPSGSAALSAYRQFSATEEWRRMTEKTSDDFFNGIEAVRFDYAANLAYLSAAFASATDSIYLKVATPAGQNVPLEYRGISRYYDDREAAVTVTADDWHRHFDQQFLYALSVFRKHNLRVATAIVTEWCDAQTWQHIQTQLDSGNVEAMAHGRNHLYVPYPDPAYEITGAKSDIIDNLKLPDLFRNGEREYVYVWVAPYGQYDDQIDALVSANQYLVSRLVYFDEQGFSSWEREKKKYAPVGVTREMGPLWGGSNNLVDLNRAFDTAVAAGGVYHVMCHPHVLADGEWSKPYTHEHLSYISNRKNLWYVSMGHLYLYHFLQDEAAIPVSVTATLGPPPEGFQLSPNYPNPFNPTTRIDFVLEQAGEASLKIFNLAGQHMQTVFENSNKLPGAYSFEIDMGHLPSGVYVYTLAQGGRRLSQKMLLVK